MCQLLHVVQSDLKSGHKAISDIGPDVATGVFFSLVLNSLTDSILSRFHPALLHVQHAILYSMNSAVNRSDC